MGISFKDVIDKMQYNMGKKDKGYNMPLFNVYNGFVGNIIPEKFTVIGGGPSSGRTSFIDSVYVMNVLLQWYSSEERPPLKIFYFSMVDTHMRKFQSLLCSYLMMTENIRMDIPTLNGQPGRLFDLDKNPAALMAVEDASSFFEELETNETLEIIDGPKAPSEIFNTIVTYMEEIGHNDPSEPYELNDDNEDSLVMLIIDSTDSLSPEFDGYGRGNKKELDSKLLKYIEILNTRFKTNVIASVSTDVGYVKSVKDTVPNIKHLGIYGKNCHIGTVLYNPILEKTIKFLLPNDEPDAYISNGRNVLRFWFVVRNTTGADAVRQRLLLLPGSAYCVEHPVDETRVTEFDDIYEILMETDSPYL